MVPAARLLVPGFPATGPADPDLTVPEFPVVVATPTKSPIPECVSPVVVSQKVLFF